MLLAFCKELMQDGVILLMYTIADLPRSPTSVMLKLCEYGGKHFHAGVLKIMKHFCDSVVVPSCNNTFLVSICVQRCIL